MRQLCGARVWVCASPEAPKVSHVSRWAEVPLLLLGLFSTIAASVENTMFVVHIILFVHCRVLNLPGDKKS